MSVLVLLLFIIPLLHLHILLEYYCNQLFHNSGNIVTMNCIVKQLVTLLYVVLTNNNSCNSLCDAC